MKSQLRPEANLQLDALWGRVDQARSRFRRKVLIRGLLWSGIAVAAVLAVLALIGHVAEVLSLDVALPRNAAVWIGLPALLLGLGTSVVRTFRTTPSRLEMARRADIRFGLHERVSTAFERSSDERVVATVVDQALFNDAVAQSKHIRPRELVTLSLPREIWYLLALVVVAVALHLMPRFDSIIPAPMTPPTQTMSAEEMSAVGAGIRNAAKLVNQDAEVRQDAYLHAVARALDELGTKVEMGAVTSAQAGQELNRLLGHLSRFYDIEAPPGSAADSSLTSAVEALVGGRSNNETTERGGPGAAEADSIPRSGVPNQERAEGFVAPNAPFQNLMDELQGQAGQDAASQAQATEDDFQMMNMSAQDYGERSNPEAVARAEAERRFLERQRQERAAQGAPIGPASNSGRGPSVLAGQGSQPLAEGMEGGGEFDASEVALEEVSLPEAGRGEGRRIEVESAPEAKFTGVGDAPRGVGEDWRRSAESARDGEYLGMMNRDVVSRYFLPAGDATQTP